jgi:hypothetical protein
MSDDMNLNLITTTDLSTVKQRFNISKDVRYKYGEINTPFFLIEKMLDLIDPSEYTKPESKWLDIGTGCGYFSIGLFKRLHNGLKTVFPDKTERTNHIVRNMIYMSEIQPENCDLIRATFGTDCNVYDGDFLSTMINQPFDFVIGNPPYNNNGLKKVPTNSTVNKKEDGITVWIPFIKKGVELLKPNGQMVVIIPSIWLKPDKAKMYEFMMNYKIDYLNCMSNTETNKIFNKYAQTPTCYFRLTKVKNQGSVSVFDKDIQEYLDWIVREKVSDKLLNIPIPLFGCNVLKKINAHLNYDNRLLVLKSNLPHKKSKLSLTKDDEHTYPNIKTCQLNQLTPELIIEYSNIPQPYHSQTKLVMAHKMYGFPYVDVSGNYGISNRDNYIILNRSLNELNRLKDFFSTKTALYLFETTRYRMKYLEKYIFELIPDITKLNDFPDEINDNTIAVYFEFDERDIKNIDKLHKKNYNKL